VPMWDSLVTYWYGIDWALIVAIWFVSGIVILAGYHGGTWHGKRIAEKIIDKERAEREAKKCKKVTKCAKQKCDKNDCDREETKPLKTL